MLSTDTIVAPATPPGEGSVGIIRLSGSNASKFLAKVFTGFNPSSMHSHKLYHGYLRDLNDRLIDEVLAVIMRGPHSYTGEDVIEVHCHGGTQILRQVLDLFLTCGARMANPGEFTLRAFLNGRLDLSQAEAVIDLIRARSSEACQMALSQLEGRLSRLVNRFATQLKTTLALVEAHIDFPDDEVGFLKLDPILRDIDKIVIEMSKLRTSFDTGRRLRDGINLLILGRPNVGKSSLMNALLGEARAIVTEMPGTTRDTLEEAMVLGGFPVRLIDSAGVRETDNLIEREGVRRAKAKTDVADLVFLVIDGSDMLREEDLLAASLCDPAKTVLVLNKADLPSKIKLNGLDKFQVRVAVSAKLEEGLDGLCDTVVSFLGGDAVAERREDVVLAERRHMEAVVRAQEALVRFQAAARTALPPECLAIELRDALGALGQITGETTPDEILDQIFSRFCIGK